jgi:hypothetical protein
MESVEKGSSSSKTERAWVAANVDAAAPLPNRKSTTRNLTSGGNFLSAEEVLGIVETIKSHQQQIQSLVDLLEQKALLQSSKQTPKE